MSDVERPSGGNGASGGGNKGGHASHGLPARNMADIARLFLEGARPLPTRIPPKPPHSIASSAIPPGAAAHHARNVTPPEPLNATPVALREAADERATAVLGLAGARNESANWKLLVQAAHGLAQDTSTAVALVGVLAGGARPAFVVDVVGVESVEELPVARSASEAGGGTVDMQIARALHRLAPAVGLWIIAAPAAETRTFPAISSIVREWLLACPTDNDGLIAGYQYLKQAWVRAGAADARDCKIAPTVYLLSEDYAQAAVVHKRLRKAAREFLGADLALAGAGPIHRGSPNNTATPEPIRVLSVACDGPEDAVWAAVLDELCPMTEGEESFPPTEIETAMDHVEDHAVQVAQRSAANAAAALDHLAQVLDPEERAALAADFTEPGVPVATPRPAESTPATRHMLDEVTDPIEPTPPIFRGPSTRAAQPGEVETPADPALPASDRFPAKLPPAMPRTSAAPSLQIENQNSKIENPPSLRAFDLEARLDRATQWQAVERSIWDLSPRSALLDARPPMSWAADTCIAIDADGRVNIWTLYKDGASWFALREWAGEHRNLLALTRRDLVVDKDAEVAVHIVLPLEDAAAAGPDAPHRPDGVAAMLLRAQAKNLRLYRLRIVEWNTRRGLVVVPIA